MKAVVFKGKDFPLAVTDFQKPKPGKNQLLVKIKTAAINHRDLWATQEQASVPHANGVVLGSDGCGVVDEVGLDVDPLWIGAEVVLLPSLDWGNNPNVQGDAFRILGNPDHGTFAEYIAIDKKYVFEKPEHLTDEEAAALPLSGLTAYRALFSKARLRASEKVLITGIGGGAALWALQLAVAYQVKVSVTSGSEEKLLKAKSLGALNTYSYKDLEWVSKAQKENNGFDVIIDSAGGDDFEKLIELAAPGGRIVNFGRTAGTKASIDIRKLFWKQLTVHGTTMGTRDEFLSLLEFIESRKVKPVIDRVYEMGDVGEAFARMQEGSQFGKIVLKVAH
ncbi:MAG: zinc-binding dehydrogenase [Bacteroidota bacterium]|jgi:zinc-binding alcohol dehydrogenase/oxidoreductase|nr:zinc-binding dehydrogenase [Cytophagales bacterium]MCE2957128.1 zinc-binding dehydrogenase [Flammeovirgaceae bacterium]